MATIIAPFPCHPPSSKLLHIVNHLNNHDHLSFNSAPSYPSAKRSNAVYSRERRLLDAKRHSSSISSTNKDNNSSTNQNDADADADSSDGDVEDEEIECIEEHSEDNNDEFYQFVSNLLPFLFQPYHGKQKVVGFLHYLKNKLGDNIEFVAKPTLHHGINVGFTWKLQWSKTLFPLGKGFSFYIHQIYQGKFLIRNLEMLVDLPLHIEPIKLKIMALVMGIMGNMDGGDYKLSKHQIKRAILTLFLIVILLLCLRPEVY
ncbi:hypothetical protein LINPERPRIM_LOCUS10302 [Linum perenne]